MAALSRPPRKDRFGNNRWLKDWLTSPAVTATAIRLPDLWKQTIIRFVCERPSAMQPGLWMARSARGAMGRVLREWHDQGRPHGWPASAFEGLYQSHAMLNGQHITKPLGVCVTDDGGSITIELRLFGEAGIWRDDVIEAMTTALASGVSLWENGKILRRWPLLDWWWEQHSTRHIPPFSPRTVLAFETPFKPGASDLFAGDLAHSLTGLISRIGGLARWNGLDVVSEEPALIAALADLRLAELPPEHSLNGFIKNDARGGLAVLGLLGRTQLSGMSEALWPYLVLGQDIGIGGHRAYGFGRYRCEVAAQRRPPESRAAPYTTSH